jgi:hypothetical protein
MHHKYAGIGSRETPIHILNLMTKVSIRLSELNFTLSSGGAKGADTAFEIGADKKIIYKPYDQYLQADLAKAFALASKLHPNWSACSTFARLAHARNTFILLGLDHKSPCKFVIAWTKDGLLSGGTAMGLRIASSLNIPIFNLGNPDGVKIVLNKLGVFIKTL